MKLSGLNPRPQGFNHYACLSQAVIVDPDKEVIRYEKVFITFPPRETAGKWKAVLPVRLFTGSYNPFDERFDSLGHIIGKCCLASRNSDKLANALEKNSDEMVPLANVIRIVSPIYVLSEMEDDYIN